MDDKPLVEADFNSIAEDGSVLAVLDSFRRITVGLTVRVVDGEGNRADAYVHKIDGSLAHLEIDWDTWVPGDDVDAVVDGASSTRRP